MTQQFTKEDYQNALSAYEYDTFCPDEFYNRFGDVFESALQLAIDIQPKPIEEHKRTGEDILTVSEFGICEAYWNGYCYITCVQSGSCEYDPICCKPTHFYDIESLPKPKDR